MPKPNNAITNLIKTACIQMTQSIIMNLIMDKFLPIITNLLKYLSCLGLIKILIYLLCSCVLFYILYNPLILFKINYLKILLFLNYLKNSYRVFFLYKNMSLYIKIFCR